MKRTQFVRVMPPPIDLIDWEAMEVATGEKNGKNGNGKPRTRSGMGSLEGGCLVNRDAKALRSGAADAVRSGT